MTGRTFIETCMEHSLGNRKTTERNDGLIENKSNKPEAI